MARGEAKCSLASRVLSQLPKCIHNSIDAQLKHGPFLLEHCHFKRKLIKYRILLNHSEHFDWLNAITQFDRCMGVHLSRFRCMLTPYKKCTKNCQLCSKLDWLISLQQKLQHVLVMLTIIQDNYYGGQVMTESYSLEFEIISQLLSEELPNL